MRTLQKGWQIKDTRKVKRILGEGEKLGEGAEKKGIGSWTKGA